MYMHGDRKETTCKGQPAKGEAAKSQNELAPRTEMNCDQKISLNHDNYFSRVVLLGTYGGIF